MLGNSLTVGKISHLLGVIMQDIEYITVTFPGISPSQLVDSCLGETFAEIPRVYILGTVAQEVVALEGLDVFTDAQLQTQKPLHITRFTCLP